MNIPVSFFLNLSTGLAEDIVSSFFCLQPWRPFCSAELNGLRNFGRESLRNHSCIIVSKSISWLRRRSRLKFLVEGHPRNLPVKLFQNPSNRFGGVVI